jgi:hypothetical protein
MKVLKILRRLPNGTLWSMYKSAFEQRYTRYTKAQVEALSHGYGLVFYSMESIDVAISERDKRPLQLNEVYEMWVCEVYNVLPELPKRRLDFGYFNSAGTLAELWKGEDAVLRRAIAHWWPSGTIMAESCILLFSIYKGASYP